MEQYNVLVKDVRSYEYALDAEVVANTETTL